MSPKLGTILFFYSAQAGRVRSHCSLMRTRCKHGAWKENWMGQCCCTMSRHITLTWRMARGFLWQLRHAHAATFCLRSCHAGIRLSFINVGSAPLLSYKKATWRSDGGCATIRSTPMHVVCAPWNRSLRNIHVWTTGLMLPLPQFQREQQAMTHWWHLTKCKKWVMFTSLARTLRKSCTPLRRNIATAHWTTHGRS